MENGELGLAVFFVCLGRDKMLKITATLAAGLCGNEPTIYVKVLSAPPYLDGLYLNMTTENSASVQRQLKAAYHALQNGQATAALEQLKDVQLAWPQSVDACHLLALTYKALGRIEESKAQFSECLKIDPNQPDVHNNLANLLKSATEYSAAEKHYSIALKLDRKRLSVWRNLAICQQARGAYDQAIGTFKRALEVLPNDASCLNGLADCCRISGDLEAAHEFYQHVVKSDPTRVNGWHNWGLNFHLQGEVMSALDCYKKAYNLTPSGPEVTQSFALCMHETGDTLSAINLFEAALRVHSNNVDLHERFNAMLWESEFSSRFGDSYRAAIRYVNDNGAVDDHGALVMSYASSLFLAGRVTQAKTVLKDVTSSVVGSHEYQLLHGQIEAELGNYDSAYQALSVSLKNHFSIDTAHQLIKIDIIWARYEGAQVLLDRAFSHSRKCQLSWALQSLVWRLQGDDRYQWLNNYDDLVKVYQLDTPSSYSSLDDFLAAAANALLVLHRNEQAPLLQTLRNGTQTAPRLLHNPDRVIQSLKQSLTQIVKTYIEELPDDASHPFLSRKAKHFEFSGSWSVKLRANGFHINHVHTDGWISSSFYILLPNCMNSLADTNGTSSPISPSDPPQTAEQRKEGWIKFGESPLQLGEREIIEKWVQPKPGMVVLFPSYCWHGTSPFGGDESDYRLTAPFDILPRQGNA